MLGAEDATIDTDVGTLSLTAPAGGRLLVHWQVGAVDWDAAGIRIGVLPGVRTGSPASQDPSDSPRDFDPADTAFTKVQVDGVTYLVVSDPAQSAQFEQTNRYRIAGPLPSQLASVEAAIVHRGGDTAFGALRWSTKVVVEADGTGAVARVFHDGAFRGSLRNVHPIADVGLAPDLYGRDFIDPAADTAELALLVLTPVTGFFLDAAAIPGSIRVARNGIPDERFEFVEETGELLLDTPILSSDLIRVRYRLPELADGTGDLAVGFGNIVDLGELGMLEAALSLRWNPTLEAFTEEPDQRTGALVASAGLERDGERFSYEVAGALAYINPNTTGVRRILGMETEAIVVPLNEDTVTIGSAPAAPAGSRGMLFYRDYRDHTQLQGPTLRPLDQPDWPPADQVFAYDDFTSAQPAGKAGPYLVASSSSLDPAVGESIVLDFDLDAAGDWVSAQLPPVPGAGAVDLSQITAISINYYVEQLTGSATLGVELGALSEDLDSDGALDEEASTASAGFIFDDADNGVQLLVGGGPRQAGNDRLDGEDANGNGILDAEQSVVAPTPIALSSTGKAVRQLLTLTASERAAVQRQRSTADNVGLRRQRDWPHLNR